jgi:hypothetical protein
MSLLRSLFSGRKKTVADLSLTELPTWKTVTLGAGPQSPEEAIEMLTAESCGVFLSSEVRAAILRMHFSSRREVLELVKVKEVDLIQFLNHLESHERTPRDLSSPAVDIFGDAKKCGLSLSPPEVAVLLFLQHRDLPLGTSVNIASDTFLADWRKEGGWCPSVPCRYLVRYDSDRCIDVVCRDLLQRKRSDIWVFARSKC